MKKIVKSDRRSKLRLGREAIRMLSGADMSQVAGGMMCPWESCDMGVTTKPPHD